MISYFFLSIFLFIYNIQKYEFGYNITIFFSFLKIYEILIKDLILIKNKIRLFLKFLCKFLILKNTIIKFFIIRI